MSTHVWVGDEAREGIELLLHLACSVCSRSSCLDD